MNSDDYKLPEKLVAEPRITASLMALEDALARLDERARLSPFTEGWTQRLLYHEACACQLTDGDLVHLDDLVLLNHGVFDAAPCPALSSAWHTLAVWQRALHGDAHELLRLPRPGEATPPQADDTIDDGVLEEPLPIPTIGIDPDDRLPRWRRILASTQGLPPTIAAAVVMDAWVMLTPEERGVWRTALLGALVLRQRGKTRSFLLPIDYGRRFSTYRRHDDHNLLTRVAGMLEWMRAAAARAEKDLHNLTLAESLMRQHLEGRRKNSRLGDLMDLLLRSPVVTIGMAARTLKVSRQAIEAMIPELGSTPRELTGNRRFRAWAIG